jgi:hypothetical protein
MYSDLYVCHFYVTQNTKYLNMISCKFVGQIAVCIQIFLLFLNSEIWFLIFLKAGSLVSTCTKSLLGKTVKLSLTSDPSAEHTASHVG